jgi:hypothetical protein
MNVFSRIDMSQYGPVGDVRKSKSCLLIAQFKLYQSDECPSVAWQLIWIISPLVFRLLLKWKIGTSGGWVTLALGAPGLTY